MRQNHNNMNMKRRVLYISAFMLATLQASAQSTKYEYDANHRLTKVTYSSGIVVNYTYDELGNRLSKTITGGLLRGDVNSDGKVNATDIVELTTAINDEPSSTYQAVAADVNGDGEVTADDVEGIVDIIMNKE